MHSFMRLESCLVCCRSFLPASRVHTAPLFKTQRYSNELSCYTTTLLHYYTTTLLHYYTTTLLHYYTTTLLHYFTTTLRLLLSDNSPPLLARTISRPASDQPDNRTLSPFLCEPTKHLRTLNPHRVLSDHLYRCLKNPSVQK